MYTKPQTTLPPITAIGNGVDNLNSSPLDNEDMSQHKQERDFEHSPPSLPPIRNTPNNQNNNSNNQSRMSINQLCNDTESDYPEEMKEAAAVLENMKTKAVTTLPPIANISQSQPQPLEPRTQAEPSQLPNSSSSTESGFMSRIGEISFVKKAYEQGKASPFIKYTAEMVKPVIQYARGSNKNDGPLDDNNNKNDDNNRENFSVEKDEQSESDIRKRRAITSRSSSPSYRNPSRSHRTSQSSGSSSYAPYTYNSAVSATTSASSSWRQIVIGTGAAVGAAGAAVSEESMKSLKYCLEWLNYATRHIDAQIMVLRTFIVNLTGPSSDNRGREVVPSTTTLASIKKEVIDTLRKVIEVVSTYAGACLPEQAKSNVRSFILNLPTRWASINHTEHSSSPSPVSSPPLAPANGHPINQTTDYARRLLSLATESLDMLRSVAGIFGETVGKAETLIESLRVVGFTAGGANAMGNSQQLDSKWPQPNGSSNGYNAYSSSSTSSHSSSGRSSRRSSNSARMNNHGRKHSRPTPVHLNDEEDDSLNGHISDSSSESEAEPMRMEMDNSSKRVFGAKSQQQHSNGISVTKKRKKGKKETDRMDLS